MRPKGTTACVFLCFLFFIPSFVFSNYKVVNGPDEFYFGHISLSEVRNDGKDTVVFREGERIPEVAVINLPLGPGDTIQTSGERRCELQFDNGTIVRLDLDSELKIETILAQSLSSRNKLTNFVLHKGGAYLMYKRYNSREMFQVMTPTAAVKPDHNAVVVIQLTEEGNTDIQVKQGKVHALFGPDEDHIQKKKIKKKERLVVSGEHQGRFARPAEPTDFELWNDAVNENFEALHTGKSMIPKPIQRLSPAVFRFAQKFGYKYGEWVWDRIYGYVWRPYFNDVYPWGNWQPYFYGRWSNVGGQLFWVPDEPWGWVPFHLGVWTWDTDRGWLWIPGSAFAPAWVTWEFYFGHYAWRPWSFWDWIWYYDPFWSFYYDPFFGFYPLYYSWFDSWRQTPATPDGVGTGKKILTEIHKDQLKKREGASTYPMPEEIKKVYKTAVTALKNGDERVISSLRELPEKVVVVRGDGLNARNIQKEATRLDRVQPLPLQHSRDPRFADPRRQALSTFLRNTRIREIHDFILPDRTRHIQEETFRLEDVPFPTEHKASISEGSLRKINESKRIEKGTISRQQDESSQPFSESLRLRSELRFRDWNPDVKVAKRLGVEVRYSSRTNEVHCPQLGLSSRTVHISKWGRASTGGFYPSSSGSSSGGISSSSGSSSSGGDAVASGGTRSGSSSGASRGGGKGTKKD